MPTTPGSKAPQHVAGVLVAVTALLLVQLPRIGHLAAAAAEASADKPRLQDTRPLVVAHRGASGPLPEHTRPAYELAVEQGADFIECDVMVSRDLALICRHDPWLDSTTNAAELFSDRTATYTIDGQQRSGVFVADLTLAELRQLKARQPWPFRDHSHDDKHGLVTLDEYLDLALAANRSVGVYPEAKHPAWHNARQALRAANTTMEALIAAALHKRGYSASAPYGSERWRRQPALIQSFELSSLRRFAGLTPLPLVLLLGGWPGGVDPDTGLTLPQLTSERKLQELAAFVTVVAPGKADLFELQLANGTALPAAAAAAAAAAQQAAGSATLRSSGLAERVRCAGLLLHTYTLRDERRFVLPGCGGDVACEFKLLFERLHVDGAFADWPATLVRFLRQQQQ